MCGRFSVNKAILPIVSELFNTHFNSETNATKPTFRQAFQYQRCLIPCNSWFEWRTEEGKKVKYLFEHTDKVPLYMAGILFQHEFTELVTLTTKPNLKCGQYHKRMPVLISNEDKDYWFQSSYQEVEPLLQHVNDEMIHVERTE